MPQSKTIATALAILAAGGGLAVQAQASEPRPYEPPADRPVGSVLTFKTASGATTQLRCTFSDRDPDLTTECGRLGGDGDDILESMRSRKAVSAYTRLIERDGSMSRVITDLVTLDRARTLVMQAVGLDNATVVCRLDGGCASVRYRSTKQQLVRELREEGKLTSRLKRSLEGEDPFLRD